MGERRHRRHSWEPLTMTWAEVADAVFRRDATWLRSHFPQDFPQPDPEYDLFHAEAVQTWARRRWGLVADAVSPEDAEAILLQRLGRHATHKAPVPRRATA